MREIFVINSAAKDTAKKIRTAAYCRVSSSSEEQLASFSSQVREYTARIEQESSWEMVDIYADEGITGTSMTKRPEFQRLLADCRRGLIDCIITKSISRFARNVKECLSVLRELKDLEINVIFEKEGINTGDLSGEMLVTVFGAIAQEESTSIGSNMKWSYEKRMQAGKFDTCFAPFGYRTSDGKLIIHNEEAEIVKWIFTSYLNGLSRTKIAEELTAREIMTAGKRTTWTKRAIDYILSNERYMGDARLQKSYKSEFPAQKKRNNGERPQYYVSNIHDAIVTKEIFEQARRLCERRSSDSPQVRVHRTLTMKIICAHCGAKFKCRVSKSGVVKWSCYTHDLKSSSCPTPPVNEQAIESSFLSVYATLKKNYKEILHTLLKWMTMLESKEKSAVENLNKIKKEIMSHLEQVNVLDRLKTKGLIKIDEHYIKSKEITQSIALLKRQRDIIATELSEKHNTKSTESLIKILEQSPENLTALNDGEVFSMIVKSVTIDKDKRIMFTLINGLTLQGGYCG